MKWEMSLLEFSSSCEGLAMTKLGMIRHRKVMSWIREIPDILMLALMMEFSIGAYHDRHQDFKLIWILNSSQVWSNSYEIVRIESNS